MRGDLSGPKDMGDFWLTRVPALYLAVERYREWVNWDKRVYLSFIRPGDVVLDVGANVGAHTVFFSHLVGARGSVVSFEPIPENVAAMRALIARRARFDNVTVVESAVGNPGDSVTAVLRIPGRDSTQASLQPQSAGSWKGQPDVRAMTCAITSLDVDPCVRGLDRINFVKIDVEGGELDVLKGAAGAIARHRPLIYCELFEMWASSFGYSPADVFDFMRSLGYEDARVISGPHVHALRLGGPIAPGMFDKSSDVIFFAAKHRRQREDFDRRYPPSATSR